MPVSPHWPALPYEEWRVTHDTLHAHTQVLGKLSAALAPPEPQLRHAALRLTARGWETRPLPAPDGSGAVVVGHRADSARPWNGADGTAPNASPGAGSPSLARASTP